MELDPRTIPWRDGYRLLIGSVVPRPIGWVSTVSAAGVANIAPFSFFNAACAAPMVVTFAPMRDSDTGNKKDTLQNVEATGEFVINIVSEPLLEKMDLTGEDFAPEIDEFAAVGLTAIASRVVKPPRIAEAPVHLECRVLHVLHFGDGGIGSGSLVVGEVVQLHVSDDVLVDGRVDFERLRPVARMGGPLYARPQLIDYERKH
ncbi:MAG: flavin reductase family protein [Vulcanimicrobiaceae bacterium]